MHLMPRFNRNLPADRFVDPGKYEFYSCEQITTNRKRVETLVQELRLLMDKAEKGAGGRWPV
jgi:hypothetical protein